MKKSYVRSLIVAVFATLITADDPGETTGHSERRTLHQTQEELDAKWGTDVRTNGNFRHLLHPPNEHSGLSPAFRRLPI